VSEDVFTSIHIEEFEVMARDTKLGQEEITRDIRTSAKEGAQEPRRGGHRLHRRRGQAGRHPGRQGDAEGRVADDAREKLLRAIFGEKASDVRDTSLKLPPGVSGTVVEVRVFSLPRRRQDERALAIERAEIERLAKDRDDEKAILERSMAARLRERLHNQVAAGGLRGLKPNTSSPTRRSTSTRPASGGRSPSRTTR